MSKIDAEKKTITFTDDLKDPFHKLAELHLLEDLQLLIEESSDVLVETGLKKQLNDELKMILLTTSGYNLILNSDDAYWGIGKDGNGKNKLGNLLIKIRAELSHKLTETTFILSMKIEEATNKFVKQQQFAQECLNQNGFV